MAWFDVVGGAARGLTQGLGDLQEDLRKRSVDKREQARLVMEQKREERAAQDAVEQSIREEIANLPDPTNIDPERVVSWGPLAKKYVTRGATGQYGVKESALAGLTRRNQLAQAEDAPSALVAAQETREAGLGETRAQAAARAAYENPNFGQQPDAYKLKVMNQLKIEPQTQYQALSPAGKKSYIAAHPSAIQANAQGPWTLAAANVGSERVAASDASRERIAQIVAASRNDPSNKEAQVAATFIKQITEANPEIEMDALEEQLGQYMGAWEAVVRKRAVAPGAPARPGAGMTIVP